MALMSWIRGESYCKFASELASSLKRDLPPALVPDGEAISASRVAKILERAYRKAREFDASHKPNFIRRAQMANEFRWRLQDLGYRKEFIDVATEGLVVYLTKKELKGEASS